MYMSMLGMSMGQSNAWCPVERGGCISEVSFNRSSPVVIHT